MIALRLCAVKKSVQAAALARRKARRRAQRDGSTIQEQTLLVADYILVLTSLSAESWSERAVLDLYRCRWQIELAFKRLKSLLQLGHLPKKDPSTAQAWMHLKLLLALLIEEILFEAKFIFPGGYNLRADQPLARFKELAHSLLSALRCPLPLKFLLANGRSLAPTHESSSPQPTPPNRIPPRSPVILMLMWQPLDSGWAPAPELCPYGALAAATGSPILLPVAGFPSLAI